MIERTYLILQNIDTGLFSVADEDGNNYVSGLDTLDATHEWLEEKFRQVEQSSETEKYHGTD